VIRRLLLATMLLAGCVAPLNGQATSPSVEFIPRALFHASGERLAGADDERFTWEGNIGGELDLVDYRVGRLMFVANYQVGLGDELRPFDANRGDYILEGSASGRLPHAELAGVFYHQSRHLSDRPKDFAIDWNMLGVRTRHTFLAGAWHFSARADLRRAIQKSFVDYTWEVDAGVRADTVIRPRVGVLLGLSVRHLGVDGSRGRDGPTGFRAEGGIRLEGGGGAVELFLAAERRLDAYPTEFAAINWATAGFRLVTR
jgi:hypothetical protein